MYGKQSYEMICFVRGQNVNFVEATSNDIPFIDMDSSCSAVHCWYDSSVQFISFVRIHFFFVAIQIGLYVLYLILIRHSNTQMVVF